MFLQYTGYKTPAESEVRLLFDLWIDWPGWDQLLFYFTDTTTR
jgi:hypothetical protein